MSLKKVGIAAATTAAAGAFILGGSALANAATPTPAPSTSSGGGKGNSSDTAVTGDELAKVTAAMKAKDAAVTVTGVRKDPDGSYDVFGTKAGAQVRYDVSADLKTFSEGRGGHGDGPGGGRDGSADTAVTGDELAKVTAAMKAKDAAVTVTGVRKDPDGSYDVLGTKAGERVMYDVSADLATFAQHAAGTRGEK